MRNDEILERIGTVVSRKDNKITLEISRQDCCLSCEACSFSKTQDKILIELENTVSANVGDKIILKIRPKNLIFYSFVLYIFPLILFLGGLFVGAKVFERNYFLISLCCIIGISVGFLIVKLLDISFSKSEILKIEKG